MWQMSLLRFKAGIAQHRVGAKALGAKILQFQEPLQQLARLRLQPMQTYRLLDFQQLPRLMTYQLPLMQTYRLLGFRLRDLLDPLRLRLMRISRSQAFPGQELLDPLRLRLTLLFQLTESPLQAQLVRLRLQLQRLQFRQDYRQLDRSELLQLKQATSSLSRGSLQRVQSGILALLVMSLLNLLDLVLKVKLAKPWSGATSFLDKMQIGRTLMNLKHLAGQVLMTAKHQIGKR